MLYSIQQWFAHDEMADEIATTASTAIAVGLISKYYSDKLTTPGLILANLGGGIIAGIHGSFAYTLFKYCPMALKCRVGLIILWSYVYTRL